MSEMKRATVKKKHWGPDDDYLTVEVQVDGSEFKEGDEVIVAVSSPAKEQEILAKIKKAREYIKKFTRSNHAVVLYDEVIALMKEEK